MNRWCLVVLAGAVAWHGAGQPAAAQFPLGGYNPPYQQRPPVSPYLNLNRSGTSPGINYYGLVKPQQQTAQQLQTLQTQQGLLANELGGGMVAPGQPVPLSVTGHPVFYFDYSRYFPLQGLPNAGRFGGGLGGGPGFGAGGVSPLGAGALARPNAGLPNVGVGIIAR